MPYELTAFQVNTWLQKKSTNSTPHKAHGLHLHVIHPKDNKTTKVCLPLASQAMSLDVTTPTLLLSYLHTLLHDPALLLCF